MNYSILKDWYWKQHPPLVWMLNIWMTWMSLCLLYLGDKTARESNCWVLVGEGGNMSHLGAELERTASSGRSILFLRVIRNMKDHSSGEKRPSVKSWIPNVYVPSHQVSLYVSRSLFLLLATKHPGFQRPQMRTPSTNHHARNGYTTHIQAMASSSMSGIFKSLEHTSSHQEPFNEHPWRSATFGIPRQPFPERERDNEKPFCPVLSTLFSHISFRLQDPQGLLAQVMFPFAFLQFNIKSFPKTCEGWQHAVLSVVTLLFQNVEPFLEAELCRDYLKG